MCIRDRSCVVICTFIVYINVVGMLVMESCVTVAVHYDGVVIYRGSVEVLAHIEGVVLVVTVGSVTVSYTHLVYASLPSSEVLSVVVAFASFTL